MKKFVLFILASVAVSATGFGADAVGGNARSSPCKLLPAPVYMSLWGNVGGTSVNFDMYGTSGSYIPTNVEKSSNMVRRQLRLVSYSPGSGRCVIS